MTFDWTTTKTYTGTLRGYRLWISRPSGYLSPLTSGEKLTKSLAHAECRLSSFYLPNSKRRPHESPRPGCGCGLYAFYQPPVTSEGLFISGAVDAFGKIVLHKKGFRAEKIQIKSLFHLDSEVLKQTSFKYPDVEMFEDYSDMVKAYPPSPSPIS